MIGLMVYFIIGVLFLLLCYRYTDTMMAARGNEVALNWSILLFLWPIVIVVMLFKGLHEWLLKIRKK